MLDFNTLLNLSSKTLTACEKENISPDLIITILTSIDLAMSRAKTVRHVTAQELCVAIKDVALTSYGGLAKDVLEHQGVSSTKDIGEIIYKLIEHDVFQVQAEESVEDFASVYDFEETFSVQKYASTLEV